MNWASKRGFKSFVVLSNGADVLVLMLQNFTKFKPQGIKKIWIRMGSRPTKRLIPIHYLYQRVPRALTEVILASHVGTGCDAISKISTKLDALNATPEVYLAGFGTKEMTNRLEIARLTLSKYQKLVVTCEPLIL